MYPVDYNESMNTVLNQVLWLHLSTAGPSDVSFEDSKFFRYESMRWSPYDAVLPGPLELWYHPHRCGLVGCGWVVVVEEEEGEEEEVEI